MKKERVIFGSRNATSFWILNTNSANCAIAFCINNEYQEGVSHSISEMCYKTNYFKHPSTCHLNPRPSDITKHQLWHFEGHMTISFYYLFFTYFLVLFLPLCLPHMFVISHIPNVTEFTGETLEMSTLKSWMFTIYDFKIY